MAVDSRAKGARAETAIRDRLRELTDLNWERVPSSGALDPKHGLKGDLYVPNEKNLYSVEVKHYAEDQLSTSLFTAKSPILIGWWSQALRQSSQVGKQPLLLFKHDRSKIFVAYEGESYFPYVEVHVDKNMKPFNIQLLDDWILCADPKFIA